MKKKEVVDTIAEKNIALKITQQITAFSTVYMEASASQRTPHNPSILMSDNNSENNSSPQL